MKKFKRAYIEITNVCNLSCSFCPKNKRKQEFMSKEFFEKILLQLKGHTEYINLHVMGEPLLHPNIDEFIDLCHEYGYKVNLTTNGTLIKKAKSKIINKKALRQINFSLHSFDANAHNEDISKYLQDIFDFTNEVKENSEHIVSLRLWNLEEGKLDESMNKKNRHILEKIENNFKMDYKIEEKLLDNRGIKIHNKIYLNQATKFNWPGEQSSYSEDNGFCHALRDQVAILVDGTVVPCCLDSEGVISLGNLKDESFKDILNGKRACDLYDGFSNRKVVEELCKKCDYRRRFS